VTEAKKNHRIDYVEFNVTDLARTKAFYGEAFGWEFKDYGAEYATFEDGHLGGGFAVGRPRRPGGPAQPLRPGPSRQPGQRREGRRQDGAGSLLLSPDGRRFRLADPGGYELAVWSDR
jgi:predicted enzyme related to lactoylglutathione lyase